MHSRGLYVDMVSQRSRRGTSRAPPRAVNTSVSGDCEEPRRERRLAAKAAQAAPSGNEHVLRHILSEPPIKRRGEAQRQDRLAVALHEALEGSLIPCLSTPDQYGITPVLTASRFGGQPPRRHRPVLHYEEHMPSDADYREKFGAEPNLSRHPPSDPLWNREPNQRVISIIPATFGAILIVIAIILFAL